MTRVKPTNHQRAALRFACRRCSVRRGEWCVTSSGRVAPYLHSERFFDERVAWDRKTGWAAESAARWRAGPGKLVTTDEAAVYRAIAAQSSLCAVVPAAPPSRPADAKGHPKP